MGLTDRKSMEKTSKRNSVLQSVDMWRVSTTNIHFNDSCWDEKLTKNSLFFVLFFCCVKVIVKRNDQIRLYCKGAG